MEYQQTGRSFCHILGQANRRTAHLLHTRRKSGRCIFHHTSNSFWEGSYGSLCLICTSLEGRPNPPSNFGEDPLEAIQYKVGSVDLGLECIHGPSLGSQLLAGFLKGARQPLMLLGQALRLGRQFNIAGMSLSSTCRQIDKSPIVYHRSVNVCFSRIGILHNGFLSDERTPALGFGFGVLVFLQGLFCLSVCFPGFRPQLLIVGIDMTNLALGLLELGHLAVQPLHCFLSPTNIAVDFDFNAFCAHWYHLTGGLGTWALLTFLFPFLGQVHFKCPSTLPTFAFQPQPLADGVRGVLGRHTVTAVRTNHIFLFYCLALLSFAAWYFAMKSALAASASGSLFSGSRRMASLRRHSSFSSLVSFPRAFCARR